MPVPDTIRHPRTADTPCPKCGGDRTRRDFRQQGTCHIRGDQP